MRKNSSSVIYHALIISLCFYLSAILLVAINETATNFIFAQEKSLVINEILPNPKEGNEWVELYNTTDEPIDLNGWFLKDEKQAEEDISSLGTIPSHSYVIFEKPEGWLNNSGTEQVILFQDEEEIDSIRYGSDGVIGVPSEGKSIGRSPDGGSEWALFPDPTKRSSNPSPTPPPTPTPTPQPSPSPSPTPPSTPAGTSSPSPQAKTSPAQSPSPTLQTKKTAQTEENIKLPEKILADGAATAASEIAILEESTESGQIAGEATKSSLLKKENFGKILIFSGLILIFSSFALFFKNDIIKKF